MALGLALLRWGRFLAWILIGYAFAVHVSSAVSAISRRPFLGFNTRWLRLSLAFFLIAMIYVPVLLACSILAWPALKTRDGSAIFLVDRRAYLRRFPAPGELIWVESKLPGSPNLARVIAGEGQQVTWSPGRFMVDGFRRHIPAKMTGKGRFRVPDKLLLVCFQYDDAERACGESVLIESGVVIGKAWAQSYPIGALRLLR